MKTKKIVNRAGNIKTGMMILALAIIGLNFTTGAYGQETTTKKEVPPPPPPPPPVPDNNSDNGYHDGAFLQVDVMPAYPGGDARMLKYICDSLRYPKEAKEKGITGKVVVRFMVNEDGTVTNVSVLKGVASSLDNEALRVVQTLPKFTPGKLNGKNVAVWFMLPINYALN